MQFRLRQVKKGSKQIKLRKGPRRPPDKTGDSKPTKPRGDDTAGGELTGNPYLKKQ